MDKENLVILELAISGAKSFPEIFCPMPANAPKFVQHDRLREKYAELACLTHPDKVPASLMAQAVPLFQKLTHLRRAADAAIDSGDYDKPFGKDGGPTVTAPKNPVHTLVSLQDAYHLTEAKPLYTGDHSVLYGAVSTKGVPVLVRIVNKPQFNARFENEVNLLRTGCSPTGPLPERGWKFFPKALDSFFIDNGKNTRYRAVVYPRYSGMMSLAEIKRKAGRLNSVHAPWIARRVMGQAVAAETLGVIHRSITPHHVLVDGITREPLHLGWSHSVPVGSPYKKPEEGDAYFAPGRWKTLDPSYDVYMAAMTICWMVDWEPTSLPSNSAVDAFPKRTRELLQECVTMRPHGRPNVTASDAMQIMTRDFHATWGLKYEPLVL